MEINVEVRKVGPGWMATSDRDNEEPFAVGTASQVAGAVRTHLLEKMGHVPKKRTPKGQDDE